MKLTLSARQYRLLDAMGIDVWVPRGKPQPAPPPESRAKPTIRQAVPDPPHKTTPPRQPSKPPRDTGPAIRFSALSIRSGQHHALVDDSAHQERAFWLDLVRASHGFRSQTTLREGRFDWPLPGLQEADAEAASKALRGFVQSDALIWLRGDALANLLVGAGEWQSFPQRHRFGEAEVWVFGSDVDLKDGGTRRVLWTAIEARFH